MLFNSYPFLFAFLPAALLGFYALARRNARLAAVWLTIASFCFYGYWNVRYVPLLLGSSLFNFLVGRSLANAKEGGHTTWGSCLLGFGVAADLALLGYYKYAGFFVLNLNAMTGSQFPVLEIILPLGISFFTFTQIAYLVDVSRGSAKEYDVISYILFVSYFPHLIAGPILHHKDMIPQFHDRSIYRVRYENIARGMTYFAIGLCKKVVLADSVAKFVAPVFSAAGSGADLTFWEAWGGVLAYTLQLYFDFSGYSDMAVGLSWLFNVRLPLNFNSPYKAGNIIDFWRRWHMTLSQFLRDYLYVALGGNRRGAVRRYANLLITMLLGGLWHGASWTYVVWGGLHGIYLMINHAWRAVTSGRAPTGKLSLLAWSWTARSVTLFAVIVAWVFFRASSIHTAVGMLHSMFGMKGIMVPNAVYGLLPHGLSEAIEGLGIQFGSAGLLVQGLNEGLWIGALLVVCLWLPNSQEIVWWNDCRDSEGRDIHVRDLLAMRWVPARAWAIVLGLAVALSLLKLGQVSEFLYFQF